MRDVIMACLAVFAALFPMAGVDAAEKKVEEIMVPDKNWTPKPGDRAEVFQDETPACPDHYTYDLFWKYANANDRTGIDRFFSQGIALKLPKGTPVLVLRKYRPDPVYHIGSMSSSQVMANLQAAAYRSAPERGEYPLEVRILDGTSKDQVRFVPEEFIAQLIPGPKPHVPAPKLVPKPIDPAVRAATALRSARNLEKARKVPGAVTLYRSIIKSYPGTPAAETAAERLKALETHQ